jgi:molybdopterin molybdotransferase
MHSYQQALETIVGLPLVAGEERVVLPRALGRRLAGPVVAPWPLPRFTYSAMDGYAVRGSDLAAGREFDVVGESAAGHAWAGELPAGAAVRISTGAPLPAGADAVVPQEQATPAGAGAVRLAATADEARGWVRVAGSEVPAGAPLFGRGTLVTPAVLAFLAGFNLPMVPVLARPRVAILTSGDELRPWGSPLGAGEIIASSLLYLEHELAACGCEARVLGIAADTAPALEALLREALAWADLVVTTAGVSVGPHDHMGGVLDRLGARVHLWKVAVRPGKPMLVAEVGGRPLLGLPGNPVSTCCNTEIFIKPLLRRAFGLSPVELPRRPVALAAPCPRDRQRLFFVYARHDGAGGLVPLPNQSSGNLFNPARANALAVVEPGEGTLPPGTLVPTVDIHVGLGSPGETA